MIYDQITTRMYYVRLRKRQVNVFTQFFLLYTAEIKAKQ